MKHIITLFIFFSIFTNPSFAFSKKKNSTLFLTPYNPITQSAYDIKLENYTTFKKNERIYFYIYNPKGFSSDYIKYQISKQEDNAHIGGYSRIRNITKRVKNKNYYVDYFVLSQSGKYLIQIFDITNLNQWLVFSEFRVVDE